MNAVAKIKIESLIANRVGHVFDRHARRPLELFPTGIATIDTTFGGFPRGAITELYGAESCGRTSLWVSALVAATLNDETCALVDCGDTFDLSSSANNQATKKIFQANLLSDQQVVYLMMLCKKPALIVLILTSRTWSNISNGNRAANAAFTKNQTRARLQLVVPGSKLKSV